MKKGDPHMRIIQILLAALLGILAIGIYVNRPPRYRIITNNGYIYRIDVRTSDVETAFPDGKGQFVWFVPRDSVKK